MILIFSIRIYLKVMKNQKKFLDFFFFIIIFVYISNYLYKNLYKKLVEIKKNVINSI
jgi:hypothetical protein